MRYFFSTKDLPDADGVELADDCMVRGEAIGLAGAILRDLNGKMPDEEWMVAVTDSDGRLVYSLRFSATDNSG